MVGAASMQSTLDQMGGQDKSTHSNGLVKVPTPRSYEKPTGLKYIPLDMAASSPVKASIAKDLLLGELHRGLQVIVHGSSDGKQQKTIYCNARMTRLFWTDHSDQAVVHEENGNTVYLVEPDCMVRVADIVQVRSGAEIDPDCISERDKYGQPLYGTAILRSAVSPIDLPLCLALVTEKGSINIQCLTKKGFNLLYINLKEVVNAQRGVDVQESEHSKQRAARAQLAEGDDSATPTVASSGAQAGSGAASKRQAQHGQAREALRLGLLLAQQEQDFGTNMYQSLTPEDEPEIERLNALGFSTEEAILHLFESRYGSRFQASAKLDASAAKPRMASAGSVPGSGAVVTAHRRSVDGPMRVPQPPSPVPAQSTSAASTTSSSALVREEGTVEAAPTATSSPVAPTPAPASSTPRAPSKTPASTARTAELPRPICPRPAGVSRMSSAEMLQLGLLLSQQEAEFGINMYDALDESDEPAMCRLVAQGYTRDEAALCVFRRKMGVAVAAERDGPDQFRALDTLRRSNSGHNQPRTAPEPVTRSLGQGSELGARSLVPGAFAVPPTAVAYAAPYNSSFHYPRSAPLQRVPPYPMSECPFSQGVCRKYAHRGNRVPYGDWRLDSTLSPRCVEQATARPGLDDSTAKSLARLLTQQVQHFGVNMFDALRPSDEPEVQALIASGYTSEQAVLQVFERCYAHQRRDRRARHREQGTARSCSPSTSDHSIGSADSNHGASTRTPSSPVTATAATAVAAAVPDEGTEKKPKHRSSFQSLLDGFARTFSGGIGDHSDDETLGHADGAVEEGYASLRYRETVVAVLRDLGYSREQAVGALLQCNGNVPLAIDALCRSERARPYGRCEEDYR